MIDGPFGEDQGQAPVTIEFQLTAGEVARAVRWDLLRKRRYYWIPGTGVPLVVAGTTLLITGRALGQDGVVGALMGFGIYELLLYAFLVAWGPTRAWRRNPLLRERQRFTFSEVGLETRSTVTGGWATWGLYRSSHETDESYLLRLVSRRGYNILPKRAFASPQDESRFRQLIERNTESHLRGELRRGG